MRKTIMSRTKYLLQPFWSKYSQQVSGLRNSKATKISIGFSNGIAPRGNIGFKRVKLLPIVYSAVKKK